MSAALDALADLAAVGATYVCTPGGARRRPPAPARLAGACRTVGVRWRVGAPPRCVVTPGRWGANKPELPMAASPNS
jgi:hypothetical protein